MRKVQKDSIVEIANLLKKAQEHIRILLKKQEYASVLDLLQQCQQGAIQIGTIIEQSEGEGFSTVKMLEEYCELVFQVFEMVQNNVPADADVVFDTMDRLLADVTESISKDIAVRKEVVFLPYKASMWDSLESVWMAADADPECDAYVVPIPYFDKNPDGTAKEMHYEGNLFPKYVPVTHYEKYDIAQRHPDMIYIHNPYDETNFVTSVHPAFYSKRLKELTDCLVYIPYFVLGEINPKNKAAVKGMEHFVTVPGVMHAHKVVVQSEAMRQIYIDVMTGLTGKDTQYYWEQKILGTGSPKFDKVHSTKKEDVGVPAEWLNIIEKPSGEWKKVIFYNTSVSALLQHSDKMLDKMRDVFKMFKKNKEEVALLWRPHPLIKATIESMRPQLWEEYRKLVEEYKEEGWGIYDDTPDMDRAVAICDGYYGDGSSVVQLVREAGKPVMLQDVNVKKNKEMVCILAKDCVKVKDKIYFVSKYVNMLCSIDVTDGELQIVGSIPEEDILFADLVAKIVYWKEKLILLPFKAKKIWIYDLNTGKWKGIERTDKGKSVSGTVFQAIIHEEKLFIIGSDCPAIICFDLQSERLVVLDEPYKRVKEKQKQIVDGYFRRDCVQKGEKLYLASCLDNYVLEFDMQTLKYRWIKVGSQGNRYAGIVWDGNCFWVVPRTNTKVVKWDGKNEVKEFSLPNVFERETAYFLGAIYDNGKIVLPGMKNYTIEIDDLQTGNMKLIEKQYSFYHRDDNQLLVRQSMDGTMEICDSEQKTVCIKCVIDNKQLAEYYKENNVCVEEYFLQGITTENDMMSISEFCMEANMEIKRNATDKAEESQGKVIWKKLRTL